MLNKMTVGLLIGMAISSSSIANENGKSVYDKACFACHSSGLIGAPKLHNEADWAPRKEKGLDALTASAIKGIGAMPARGACMDCSDDDIKDAIQYMAKFEDVVEDKAEKSE